MLHVISGYIHGQVVVKTVANGFAGFATHPFGVIPSGAPGAREPAEVENGRKSLPLGGFVVSRTRFARAFLQGDVELSAQKCKFLSNVHVGVYIS